MSTSHETLFPWRFESMKALLLALGLLLTAATPALRAQGQILEETVFPFGTVKVDHTHGHWSYVVLQPLSLTRNRPGPRNRMWMMPGRAATYRKQK